MNKKKIYKRIRWVSIGFLGLLVLLWLLIQTDWVQNKLIKFATQKISNELGTEVSIQHISLSLFNKLNMEGTLVRDQQKDTLLYAGIVRVRITDWFFLKKKSEIKFAGLEDAVIKLNRKDSIWNYQFIADHFAGPPSSTPKKKQNGINLTLKKLDFKNVEFISQDDWIGEKMIVRLGALILDAQSIDLNKQIFLIDEITIEKPFFEIDNYNGNRPPSIRKRKPQEGYYFNPGNLYALVRKLTINKGIFSNNANASTNFLPYFDGQHLQFKNIQAEINQLEIKADTISAKINLSTTERSGFQIKQLKANYKLTPQIMEFDSLFIKTNKSVLQHYYAMKYNDFNEDMNKYIDSVTMVARFKNASVHTDDIAFFAPELENLHHNIQLSGNFIGSVAAFKVDQLLAKTGTNTILSGNLSMKGLPDINQTNIVLNKAYLRTDFADAQKLLPYFRDISNPDFEALKTIFFSGNFSGTFNNFKTTGLFKTDLGSFNTDIALNFIPAQPIYSGKLITQDFNVGSFFKVKDLGNVTFNGEVNGSSFLLETMKANFKGKIDAITYNNYTYREIELDGEFQKKYFSGELIADDSNFNFTSTLQINFNSNIPHFNILGDLTYSNFKALHFTEKNLQLVGLLDLNFSANNIDNFTGSAKLLNASIKQDDISIEFDSLGLYAQNYNNVKDLSVRSNEFDITVKGSYQIQDLASAVESFLSKYYPSYINTPKINIPDEDFTVSITTRNVNDYVKLLDKNLSGFDYAYLEAEFNTMNQQLIVQSNIPTFSYNNIYFNNIILNAEGNLEKLDVVTDIGLINIGDSTSLPDTKINITSKNDLSKVKITTKASNTLNDANIEADVFTIENGVRINFKTSSFVINDKRWELEKDGELIIKKNFTAADKIKFTSGFQEIYIQTEETEGGNTSDIVVDLSNVFLGDFLPFVVTEPKMSGTANGKIYLRDFYGNFNVDATLSANEFRLNEDSIGKVDVTAAYSDKTGDVTYKISSPNQDYNFTANGYYKTKANSTQPLMVELKLNKTRVNYLETFLGEVFSDIDGFAYGNLKVFGDPLAPDLLGKVQLKNAQLKVDFSQVTYYIDSADIDFKEGVIDFGNFVVKDKFNQTGFASGKLYQKGFKNLRYDFDVITTKLLLLDTKFTDNQQLYGTAIGKASLSLKGPENNLVMTIAGEATDSSHIFIPNANSKGNDGPDFIVFKQYGKEAESKTKADGLNLTINLDLVANNFVKVDVILDDLTGDVIKATGNGRLRIKVGTTEALTMRGRYNIESGFYDFNFQSFIRKPFTLLPNAGSYIEWTGDPMNADIHIEAQYTAERISTNTLIQNNNTDFSSAARAYRGDVYVIATLTGKLMQPDISFKLEFPQGSPIKTEYAFTEFIRKIESDENEILKQVTYLIVFSSFAPYGEGITGNGALSNNFTSLGVNTISQKITSEINKVFSNLLYQITGDKSISFDLNSSVYSSSSLFGSSNNATRLDRTQVNFKIGKSLLNNKVIISFGGDLDFNLGAAAQSGNFQWLPDLTIEVILSPDRKLRAIIFNRNTLDIAGGANALGRRNRQGISISYKKDFEKLFATKEEDIEFKPAKN